jgi:hypothetical protein
MGLIDRIKAWFPPVDKYRKEADDVKRDVAKLKSLTFDGDLEWFIDRCREHREEVCNEDDAA